MKRMIKSNRKGVVYQKIISTFLVIVLSVGLFPKLSYAETEFVDVSKEHWAYNYIYSMANAGAINGYPDGTFKPENYVTRAEFCAMTILAAGIIPGATDNKKQWEFTYADNNHWANKYMKSMFYYTWDYGKWYLLNNLQPDAYISRAEVAMGLYEIVNDIPKSIVGFEDEVRQTLSEKYSDYAQFGGHTASIYFASQKGFIGGYPDGTFKPSNLVTRAEMCTMLYRAYSKEIDENISAEYSDTLKWFDDFFFEVNRDIYLIYRTMNNSLTKINGTPYLSEEDLKKRISANAGDTAIKDIITQLNKIAIDNGTSLSKEIIDFVQDDINYLNDPNNRDYAKFPYETIYDGGGDCEDKAILMCSLLNSAGYDVCLIVFSDHVGLGVAMQYDVEDGYYYKGNNNQKYYYLETTASGWEPGDLPEDYINATATLLYP